MIDSVKRRKEIKDRANILTDIVKMNIYQLDEFANKKHKILMTLYEERVINDNAVEQALNRNLRDHARNEFRYLTDMYSFITELHFIDRENNDNYPTAEYLVHGIKLGVFSKDEIKKIPILPYDTIEDYIKAHDNPHLLEELRHRILNPNMVIIEKPKIFNFLDDPVVY